ncbi:DNase I-like protein [Schizophyllum commune Loenen D]|nr:DNase I-like protein [Schizophyllum commune Loenen D]
MTQDIETKPSEGVRNLKSRFEKLAVDSPAPRPQSFHAGISPAAPLLDAQATARPTPSPLVESPNPNGLHVRSASHSPDMRALKRPPPPPPAGRSSRHVTPSPSPSPAPSPLLRPMVIEAQPPPLADGDSDPIVRSPSVASVRSFWEAGQSPQALPGQGTHTPRGSIAAMAEATMSPPPTIARPSPPTVVTSPPTIKPPVSPKKPPVPPVRRKPPPTPQRISPNASPSDSDEGPFTPSVARPSASPSRPRREGSHTSSGSDTGEASNAVTHRAPPPRPPPRHRATVQTQEPPHTPTPPPLPIRKQTAPAPATPVEEYSQRPPASPALPPRPRAAGGAPMMTEAENFDKKGLHKLQPPPTRTIALGDKLPPPRRAASPSDEEESSEEESTSVDPGLDLLPDSSRSSRRPPVLSLREPGAPPLRVTVPAYIQPALAGKFAVVASGNHVRVYDMSMSDSPIIDLGSKDFGLKELKATAATFRDTRHVWIGTKEGHLFELDVLTASLTGARMAAHLHAVSHIFRHGDRMLTADTHGKMLVFAPSEPLTGGSSPRVVRFAEKQDFVQLLGGKLWTANRADQHNHGLPSRLPIIRVYDIFNPAAAAGKSLLPIEHVGAVTSATIIPSLPDTVYMGHEEGFVSIWDLKTPDGHPKCTEVMKVSTNDILCLEGVNEKLWVGGRGGNICVYDVVPRPWLVTNAWLAHPTISVLSLQVDYLGMDETKRLVVASCGRDETLKLWDGLLAQDWIDNELLTRESEFSTFRDLNVLVVSWNVDSAKPEQLTGTPANCNFLSDVLASVDAPDIIHFGFQEVVDLENRRVAAKSVLMNGIKKTAGAKERDRDEEVMPVPDKVSGAYRRWHDALSLAVRLAMPADCPYSVIHTESLVGLFSLTFVKNSERVALRDMAVTTVKRGMGGRYGNKGGIISRFVIEDSSICMINCHLAAGQNNVRARNADIASFLEEKALFPTTVFPLAYVGGGDGTTVLDHEIVLVNGDMNYRIDNRREAIIAAINAGDIEMLHNHDQLLKEMKFNRGFRFRGFSEGPLKFIPTYKYDRRSDEWDTSEKRRSPAWCDRVLWRSRVPERVRQLHYKRYEPNVSDHRPISAGFTITVKRIMQEQRQHVKAEVMIKWQGEQDRLLMTSRQFFAQLGTY